MIKNFDEMMLSVKESRKKIRVAVAAAQDDAVLRAVYAAYQEGICDAILVGDEKKIIEIELACQIPKDAFQIVDTCGDLSLQCAEAVKLIMQGQAQTIMKGLVETPILLKAILSQKKHLLKGELMNHIAVFDIPKYHKLLFMSDSAMVVSPTLEQKHQIILNALQVMKAFQIEEPKIGILCAKENVDPKMPATEDAVELLRMNREGLIKGCMISGPIAMDVAVSKEAAVHKGIKNVVAGDADFVLMPYIEAGNIFYKALVQFGDAKSAGIITGGSMPVVLTSRSDSVEAKLYALAMAALVASGI